MDTLRLPRFTPRDEERERMSLTTDDIANINSDILGLTARLKSTSISDDTIERSLRQLDDELEKIPDAEKSALLEAQLKYPQLVRSDDKVDFLRIEAFDAKRAARRLVGYWSYRKELFGDKCYLPLTPEGALKDDLVALSEGYIRLLPHKDAFGRAILFFYPSRHKPSMYSHESLARVFWYLLENARKDPGVKEHGFIVLASPKNATFDQFDPMSFWRCALSNPHIPVKFRSCHICYPDKSFHIILPIIKFIAGKRYRERLLVHDGSEEHVLQQLLAYGIPPERVPSVLGGNVNVFNIVEKPTKPVQEENAFETFSKQVRDERRGHEVDINIAGDDSAMCTSIPSGPVPLENAVKAPVPLSVINTNAGIDKKDVCGEQNISISSTNDADERISCEDWLDLAKNCCEEEKEREVKKSREAKKCVNLPGRKGDQRMNRALEAKLTNPDISLVEALMEGGFIFPDHGKSGCVESKVLDIDGVSMMQRKNQLTRRLRKIRRRDADKKKSGESHRVISKKENAGSTHDSLQKERQKISYDIDLDSSHFPQKTTNRLLPDNRFSCYGQKALSLASELRRSSVEKPGVNYGEKGMSCSCKKSERTKALRLLTGVDVPTSKEQGDEGVTPTDQPACVQNNAQLEIRCQDHDDFARLVDEVCDDDSFAGLIDDDHFFLS